ncbi:hypothetical protein GGR56DRAFT_159546 [Xylariaceae sp. FL0804]|nr:hypothetical protein GGR56DRAFT_159546 [Xylariaceae sp. FL0804]
MPEKPQRIDRGRRAHSPPPSSLEVLRGPRPPDAVDNIHTVTRSGAQVGASTSAQQMGNGAQAKDGPGPRAAVAPATGSPRARAVSQMMPPADQAVWPATASAHARSASQMIPPANHAPHVPPPVLSARAAEPGARRASSPTGLKHTEPYRLYAIQPLEMLGFPPVASASSPGRGVPVSSLPGRPPGAVGLGSPQRLYPAGRQHQPQPGVTSGEAQGEPRLRVAEDSTSRQPRREQQLLQPHVSGDELRELWGGGAGPQEKEALEVATRAAARLLAARDGESEAAAAVEEAREALSRFHIRAD